LPFPNKQLLPLPIKIQNPAQSVENVKHLILDGIFDFPLGEKTLLSYTVMEAAEKEIICGLETIRKKLAKLLMMSFAYRSTCYIL